MTPTPTETYDHRIGDIDIPARGVVASHWPHVSDESLAQINFLTAH